VQFEGVSLSGFQGNAGTIITVTLRALKTGSGTIAFQSGQVLANDGQGTDITSGVSGATYQIEAAKIKSNSPAAPPQQEQVTTEAPVAATLTAPVISLEKENDVPAIVGTSAYPKANVSPYVRTSIRIKTFHHGTCDGDGNFTLDVPQALRNGPYAVSAVMVLDDRTKSDTSNVLTVEVGGVFVADVSWENATYISIALIIALGGLVAYFLWRRYFGPKRKLRVALKKEVKEAEDALHQSFAVLGQDVADHLKGKREDAALLKKDLKEAESYIGKEIKDIDRIDVDEKE